MNTAIVKIWGTIVGAVAWNDERGYSTFEYDSKFKEKVWELAPFQMPLRSQKRIHHFPALRKKDEPSLDTFKGLPGLLADVLPDRYGHELINVWLTQQGRPMDSMNPIEMLCFIGTRGMGALEFEPNTLSENKSAFPIEMDSLVDVAQKILNKKQAFITNLSTNEEKAILEILTIGTSAGGARPKAVIAYNEKTGEVKSGQTNAPNGFEHWLIKLDGVSDIQVGASTGFGRVEMAYYNMAIACGIKMMPSRLLEENGRAHFMTKRFDREGPRVKHHIQTFCALKHVDFNRITSFSYEQLFQTLRELKLPYSEAEQLFRRMVFNVLAQNCDDHTKNFAFRLQKDSEWELAPAYDLCHAYQPNHRWVSQHALSVNGKRSGITKEDLLFIGHTIKNKKAAQTIKEISQTINQWGNFADEVQVSFKLRDSIASSLIQL